MPCSSYGSNQNGFIAPTIDDIRDDIITDAQTLLPQLSFDENKIETAFVEMFTNQISCLWNAVNDSRNQNNATFASGCKLDRIGTRNGLFRYTNESDADYRSRIKSVQSGQVGNTGSSCFSRLYSDLFAISNVTDVQINLNDTSEQLGNLPPNSYEVMVFGGDSESVGNAIWNNHPTGITLTGNTTVQITDCTGVCRDVYLTRPKLVPIYLDFRLERTGQNCGCPTDNTTVIKNVIQNYLDSDEGICFTRIGQPVYAQDFFNPIYSIQGIGITCALVSRDGLCADEEFVTLKRDEIPFFSTDCMNIQFTPEANTPCETGIYSCPPEECTFQLSIEKTADKTEFTSVGEIITYSFVVTNTGVAPLTTPILITDDKASVTCPTLPAQGLAVGDSVTCTALYETTYDDAVEGSVTNKAQAVSGNIFSPCVELSVDYSGPELFHEMTLTKELVEGECTTVGNLLTYRYRITNTGTVPITGQPIVSDDKIGGVICPPLPSGGLLPNSSISTTAQSVVTQEILDSGECCNSARAVGQSPLGTVASNSVTLCIECIDSNTGNPPTCPASQTINCSDMPVTISGFSGATSITGSSSNYTITPNATNTEVVIDTINSGVGPNETISLNVSNGSPWEDCQTIITVNECGSPEPSDGEVTIPTPVNCSVSREDLDGGIVIFEDCIFLGTSDSFTACGVSVTGGEIHSQVGLGSSLYELQLAPVASVPSFSSVEFSSSCAPPFSIPVSSSTITLTESQYNAIKDNLTCSSGYTFKVNC